MPNAIIDHIRNKLRAEINDLLKRAQRVRERDIQKAKQELEEWIDEQNKKMVREKIRAISRKRASAMKQLRLEKEQVYERLWQEFESELKFALSKSYRDEHYIRLIFSVIGKVKSEFGVADARLLFNNNDREFFEANWEQIRSTFGSMFSSCNMEIGESIDMSGGVIIEEKHTKKRFVFSFDAVIEAERDYFKKWLIDSVVSSL